MNDLLSRPAPTADHRIHYRSGELQFGDLWLPKGQSPVVVFVHGGWWKAEYGLEYAGHLCAALKREGIATWSLEYRRVGNARGGWPGTFEDVANGYDYLSTLGRSYPLDLKRIVVMGHSAGGHLAYWLAGREHLPFRGELVRPSRTSLPMRGAISLAGAVDLRMTVELAGEGKFAHDRTNVTNLMGGSPSEQPTRYRAGNPGELLPLNVPQVLIQGTEDDQIPGELPKLWAERGRKMGERVEVEMIAGAGHLDVADPDSKCWNTVLRTIKQMLG